MITEISTEISIKKQTLSHNGFKIQANWQKLLANAIRDPNDLFRALDLNVADAPYPLSLKPNFRLLVPHAYLAKIQKGNWYDPLLRQVLPLGAEQQQVAGFISDPVGDQDSMVAKGLLHKYQGRVLLVATGACAIHCRYCFRQHFPYGEANPAKQQWNEAINYIAAHSDVTEVILSGGDPLVLSDRRLQVLCERIAMIPHVKRLRIHTRLPVVLPERIDAAFIDWFKKLDLQKIMVIHANHAQEIGMDVKYALSQLKAANTLLLNQSVLLKGVNDSINALSTLSESLIAQQVLPYYLHLLDKVQGAAHFEVTSKEAMELMKQLRNHLSGYMIPKLVREVAGEASKQAI
jgi:EF-P beta-lysylation protein EpmB